MKSRLRKNLIASVVEADAARLVDLKMDSNAAIQAIAAKDPYFKQDRLICDNAAGTCAYWGAISDDGLYVCEVYMYKGVKDSRKAAFVAAPVDSPQAMEVIIKNISTAGDIRSIVRAGFSLPSGVKVKFSNEYKSVQDVPKQDMQNNDSDNVQVASKK